MLKLIIVDDEKIIRETISTFIDWNSLGVKIVGTCQDGIEAYDMILDESPDIVLTDIKMPGLSGLDLIKQLWTADHNVEFIILSGYSDFEFAKTAMKYGVKHYLLKPCNESEIIEVIKLVKEECYRKCSLQAATEERNLLYYNFRGNMIKNILLQYLIEKNDFQQVIQEYEVFLDFNYTEYELCYFYYLEESYFDSFRRQVKESLQAHHASLHLYILYVKNTMVLFFNSFSTDYQAIDHILMDLIVQQQLSAEYKRETYPNLYKLLSMLIIKLERYDKIQILDGSFVVPIYNHNALFHNMNEITSNIFSDAGLRDPKIRDKIQDLLESTDDLELLKAFATNLLLKLPKKYDSTRASTELIDFVLQIGKCTTVKQVRAAVLEKIELITITQQVISDRHRSLIDQIITCVDDNLANQNLSLKWIADHFLYMNVDYLSRQFVKQTGMKFSQYLTRKRIETAKELLLTCGQEKIYMIAEYVGCGNNPQYFSQIFKKQTGITPSAYIKKMEETTHDATT